MNDPRPARRWRNLAAPVALMAVTFIISSIPGDQEQTGSLLGFVPAAVQNLLHIPLYALLAWTWCRALATPSRRTLPVLTLAASISIAWSIFDELHQLYVPGRYASLTDLALNLTGIAIGLGLFVHSHWQRRIT